MTSPVILDSCAFNGGSHVRLAQGCIAGARATEWRQGHADELTSLRQPSWPYWCSASFWPCAVGSAGYSLENPVELGLQLIKPAFGSPLLGFERSGVTACFCLVMAVLLGAPAGARAQRRAEHGVGGAKPFIHLEVSWEGDVDKLANSGIKVNKFPWPESYRGMEGYEPYDKGRGSNYFDTDPSSARSKFDPTEICPQLHQTFARRLKKQGVAAASYDESLDRDDVPYLVCTVKIQERSGGSWSWSVSATARGSARHISRNEIFSTELWNAVGKYEVTRGTTNADSLKTRISQGVEYVADEFASAVTGVARAESASPQGATAPVYAVPEAALVQAKQRIQPLLVQFKISVEPTRVRIPFFKPLPVNYVFFVLPAAKPGERADIIAVGTNGRVYSTFSMPAQANITNLLQQIYTVSSEQDAMRYGFIHLALVRAKNASTLKFSRARRKITSTAGGVRLQSRMPISSSSVPNDDRTAFALDLQFNSNGKMDRPRSTFNFVTN